jgi:hypothetical protein
MLLDQQSWSSPCVYWWLFDLFDNLLSRDDSELTESDRTQNREDSIQRLERADVSVEDTHYLYT